MKIQRTIPPTAAPIGLTSLLHGAAGSVMGGRYIKGLEHEVKDHFGVRHVFLLSSGKAALTIILKALNALTPDRDSVLIPAYTCFSVPSAIVKAGLKISLCDIDPPTFDFDYRLIEEAMDKDTLCVVPGHLFGIPADMDRLMGVCGKKKVPVVEDAAQAMGGRYKGRLLGTLGDVGFFSLGRGKNITCGSGGIIVTNSDTIAHAIGREYSVLKFPGIAEEVIEFMKAVVLSLFVRPTLYWLPSGLPFLRLGQTMFYRDFPVKRLSGMRAGLLRRWQKRLEESNRARKQNADYFRKGLGARSANEEHVPLLRMPVTAPCQETRDAIYASEKSEGLGISRMYPAPVNEIEELADQFAGSSFPAAKQVSERLLTVPTHQLLSEQDRENIVTAFAGLEAGGQSDPAGGCKLSQKPTLHTQR